MDDDMRQSLLLTMELQETRARAEEDLKSRDDQILHLKNLLSAAIKERDEAQHHCNKIMLDKILLHHHLKHYSSAPNSGISSIEEDDPTRGIEGFSSDESIASSPQRILPPPPAEYPVAIKGPLPEKGKLLRAVVEAGPLLHTLLLAGPLPRWRHPPPPVDPRQIPPPPVVVPPPSPPPPARFLRQDGDVNDWAGMIGGKRGLPDGFDWSIESKRQRVGSFIELK